MTDCTFSKDTCYTNCLLVSGADKKDKGKMKLKYEQDEVIGGIDTCIAAGSTAKQCIQTQFNNKNKNNKNISEAVKQSIYSFIESAVELNEGDTETIKSNILEQLKTYCETEFGIKRVDEKFMIKMVKNVACNK